MGCLACDLDFPVLLSDSADEQVGGHLAVNIDAHDCPAEIGGIQFAGTVEAALFANGEQQRDRRVRELVLQEGLGQRDQDGTAGASVAAEGGGAIRDDTIAFTLRFGSRAERHGVEVGRKQQTRSGPGACQFHDEVARFGRHRNALVDVIEANSRSGDADFLQGVGDRGGDFCLLPRHAVHRKKLHQMRFRRGDIQRD